MELPADDEECRRKAACSAQRNRTGRSSRIWYSITAGDFDQDGDDDHIAGNLGDNHRFTMSSFPLNLYAIDLTWTGTSTR
jgi:hypothetical protein